MGVLVVSKAYGARSLVQKLGGPTFVSSWVFESFFHFVDSSKSTEYRPTTHHDLSQLSSDLSPLLLAYYTLYPCAMQ